MIKATGNGTKASETAATATVKANNENMPKRKIKLTRRNRRRRNVKHELYMSNNIEKK